MTLTTINLGVDDGGDRGLHSLCRREGHEEIALYIKTQGLSEGGGG